MPKRRTSDSFKLGLETSDRQIRQLTFIATAKSAVQLVEDLNSVSIQPWSIAFSSDARNFRLWMSAGGYFRFGCCSLFAVCVPSEQSVATDCYNFATVTATSAVSTFRHLERSQPRGRTSNWSVTANLLCLSMASYRIRFQWIVHVFFSNLNSALNVV